MSNPRGAGRKPGQKDTAPRISELERRKAEMMFITGSNVQDIRRALNRKTGDIIYKWIDKYDWISKRDKYLQDKENDYLARMLSSHKENTTKTLNDIKTIKDKVMDTIPTIDPDKARLGETVSAYATATDMERKIGSEGIEVAFVTIVSRIIRDVIQDPKLLAEISDRIVQELNDYRGRPLIGNKINDNTEQIEGNS